MWKSKKLRERERERERELYSKNLSVTYKAPSQRTGFTLIEIIVTVAIFSILAGSVSIGFGSFSDTVNVRNVSGYISDILYELNLEAISRENKKSSVYFEDSYLLVNSEKKDANLILDWEKVIVADDNCVPGDIRLISSDDVQLFERSADDLLYTVQMSEDEEICIDPLEYKKREIIYELQTDTDFSNKIRIFPLNLNLRGANDIFIETNDYRLDILPPYSQKKRYKNNILLDDKTEAVITVKSTDGETEADFNLPEN